MASVDTKLEAKKQAVEELSKNFSELDKNKDGKLSKEEFTEYKGVGLPKLTPEEKGKYFDQLAGYTEDKNSIEKGDLTREKINIGVPLSEGEVRAIVGELKSITKMNHGIDVLDDQTAPVLKELAGKDLSELLRREEEKFGISVKDAQKFMQDPEVQQLCKLLDAQRSIEDKHRQAGGDFSDPQIMETLSHVRGLISDQHEKVVPAVESLLGIPQNRDDQTSVYISKFAFKKEDGTSQDSIIVTAYGHEAEDTYNYGSTTLSRSGEVLFSEKEKFEPMNKIIDAMVIAFKDGSEVDLSQIEKIANSMATGYLREGEKIVISRTRIDKDDPESQKLAGIGFSVQGIRNEYGEKSLPLGSVSLENDRIRVSTFSKNNYFKDRGLKD